MVPDFSQLRKQPRGRASSRSLKPSTHKGFHGIKSSQQFDTQPTSTPAGRAEHDFFALWTTCPSWSPILKKSDGWLTIVNPSGKKVPLVLGAIKSHYRRDYIIGKRFGRLTNYLMIDVDKGSPFHPDNGGIRPILDAMESLGLCRYLLIRSSASGGLHIYFPLAEPVSSWGIACAAHAALTAAGVSITGGSCELFPNKKAFNAEHNGHRLPLQQGSFILDDDFRCIGSSKTVFLQQWQHCEAGQDDALLADVLAEKPLPIPKRISVSSLPPITWTGMGQSNEVMKELVNFGDRYLGLKTIPALSGWMVTVAPQLPGFELFASQESKNDLMRKNWAYRWAKSHFKSARQYAAKTSSNHNATVAAEALERLKVALSKLVIVGKFGIKKLWQSLSNISKELFGVGFSWGLFQKHRQLILAEVSSARKLGLSKGCEENRNSTASELAGPLNSRIGEKPEKHLTELLTAKYVTAINTKDLSASCTPPERGTEQAADGQQIGTEPAMGATVKVRQPGGDIDGVQAWVTKTTDADGRPLC